MGSMVVLSEKEPMLDSAKTLTNSTATNESDHDLEEDSAERTAR